MATGSSSIVDGHTERPGARRGRAWAVACLVLVQAAAFSQERLPPGKAEQARVLEQRLWEHPEEDTVRVGLLIKLADVYVENDPQRFDHYGAEAVKLAEKLGYAHGLANINRTIGLNLDQYRNDQFGAVEYLLRALHAAEAANDTLLLPVLCTDVGGIYTRLMRDTLAETYLTRAIELGAQYGNERARSRAIYNLSRLRSYQGRLRESIILNRHGLDVSRREHDTLTEAAHIFSMGLSYKDIGEKDSAIDHLERSVILFDHMADHRFLAFTLGQLAMLYGHQGQMEKAYMVAERGLGIAQQHNLKKEIMDNYQVLSLLAAMEEDYKAAYDFHILYDAYYDSTRNVGSAERAGRSEAMYQAYKREEAVRLQHEREQALALATEKRQRLLLLLIGSVAVALTTIAVLVYQSLRITKKQKLIIEEQKRSVEEKQRAIIDSINYSKRLQQAILPPESLMREHFRESFVLYMPKDIVSGDFYWMEVWDDTVFLAVADCTGHGVPGALISVVCANALNHAVKDFGLRDTGLILDKATDLVLDIFERHHGDVKDGMDVSLLAWDKRTNQMQWSGANMPLWIVQDPGPGARPLSIVKIKPDRQPIGKHLQRKPFTSCSLEATPGTTFYMFTDGFSDQFGGPRGKKLMPPGVESAVLSTYDSLLGRQGEAMAHLFTNWKGPLEQTDDVTMVALRT